MSSINGPTNRKTFIVHVDASGTYSKRIIAPQTQMLSGFVSSRIFTPLFWSGSFCSCY
ncbi:20133_t:CDS:2 [Dentiscutata erythropus]|uniref:20133_t:CDS:1 n=1 Tax=Dentiscutata erythropus TaxID=1348616 RepID=A0A9N8VB42_9GLOM|nr:20133_t:CDS:2 [Dentiscutata erythropus]